MAPPGKKTAKKKTAAAGKAVPKKAASKKASSKKATSKKASSKKAAASKPKAGKTPASKAKKKVKRAATRKKTGKKAGRRPPPARRKAAEGKSPSAESGASIHCTLAATGSWSMLLPTSAIAEITDYAPPAPLDGAPAWLLGQVEWEDWQVPVISYGALIDDASPETATAQSRIMVVKSLSSAARVPFIGVLVSEIPKLASLTQSEIEVTDDEVETHGVHCKVKVGSVQAVIPDLDRLSQLVAQAAYG